MPVILVAFLFWGGGIALMETKAECVNPDSEVGMCLIDGVVDSVSQVTSSTEDYIKENL